MSGNVLEINVGEFLFAFANRTQWINKATSWYLQYCGAPAIKTAISIDDNQRLCTRGKHFMDAAYPVRVYSLR